MAEAEADPDKRHVGREAFFSIMTAFPTGVTVVTAVDAQGVKRGLTTNAITSVSADPPLLLVCVDKDSRTLPAIVDAKGFVVNFMADNSEEVCRLFASKADEKFEGLSWTESPGGLPVLHEHIMAWAECSIHQQFEVGDHVVFVGLVRHGQPSPLERFPIAYFRRVFRPYAGEVTL